MYSGYWKKIDLRCRNKTSFVFTILFLCIYFLVSSAIIMYILLSNKALKKSSGLVLSGSLSLHLMQKMNTCMWVKKSRLRRYRYNVEITMYKWGFSDSVFHSTKWNNLLIVKIESFLTKILILNYAYILLQLAVYTAIDMLHAANGEVKKIGWHDQLNRFVVFQRNYQPSCQTFWDRFRSLCRQNGWYNL